MMESRWKVLIAHAEDEEDKAELLADPIRAAGYEVAHRGTVMIGESVVEDASKILALGGPVVVCATIQAIGTGWADDVALAARHKGAKVYIVQMEKKARIDKVAFSDEVVAQYWKDPEASTKDLIDALQKHYPLSEEKRASVQAMDKHQRALERYRKIALQVLPAEGAT